MVNQKVTFFSKALPRPQPLEGQPVCFTILLYEMSPGRLEPPLVTLQPIPE
ncbi:hypothetical protein SAMN05421736_10525 [Evansella caseinilytica]|uniref:Uncharacterized protein n=1 Tax=Evansella caseinilytica TaxID=1503961 RepID=A0A1H3PEV6_9BACI|nr:hypothetical protein SAMN05421736_10525 [Evansella caseinilytica]